MATVNPLNEFNTFSYHHFLVLVNSTAAADALKDSNLFFRFANGEEDVPGARIIVNPIKSIRYVIQDISWTNWMVTDYAQFGGTVMSGGEFRIIEPNGMSFMNDLFDAFGYLQCGMSSSQWVIKTIFVGQTNVGDTATAGVEYINNINPMLAVMTNMDATFSEAGGEYTFEFVSAGSGAGLTPSGGGQVFSQRATVNLSGGDTPGAVTVEQGLQTLERHLNETAAQAYTKLDESRQRSGGTFVPPLKTKYVIKIPDTLKRPEYTIRAPARMAAGPDGSTPYLTVDPSMGVVAGIMSVIKLSAPLMTSATTPGQLREHYVNTSEVLDSATNTKTFIFTIMEREIKPIADSTSKDGGSNSGDVSQEEQDAAAAGNLLEFDYLYTGKNIDVLSYDMKLGSGLAFLETMVGLSAVKDDRTNPTTPTNLNSMSNTKEVGSNSTIPMGIPSTPGKSVIHNTNPGATAAYEQLLQQHSVLSVMSTIRIRGNPRILNDVTPTLTAEGSTTDRRTAMGVVSSYGTQPARVRVNIRMPRDGDLTSIEDFWYKGTHLILCVKSEFSAGEFTQEIQMAAEMDGLYKNTPEQPPQPAQDQPVSIVGETADAAARIRAFLAMIRYCEGTTGDRGYTTLFGYSQFTGFDDHPRTVITSGGYKSSAAGAYQILEKTWDGLSKFPSRYAGKLNDFSPASQDLAGWCLLDRRGALPAIRSGNIAQAVTLCNREWASLPGSPYGQPVKTMPDVLSVYNRYLAEEIAGQTTLKAPLEAIV